ncbi:MAG: HDIG domain-containing protein [Spirochaetales bacterium]|nr:HDIG domain-containing protein [Spirochaetales bacterium]
MKQNNGNKRLKALLHSLISFVTRDIVKTLTIVIAFMLFFIIFFFSRESSGVRRIKIEDYIVGQPSPRELVVDRDIAYTDEEATRLKMEAEILLVPPVFSMEREISELVFTQFDTFKLNFSVLIRQGINGENLFLKLQTILPGFFSRQDVLTLQEQPDIQDILILSEALMVEYMDNGVFSFPSGEVPYHAVVKVFQGSDTTNSITVKKEDIFTLESIETEIQRRTDSGEFPPEWQQSLIVILSVFLRENTYYNSDFTDADRKIAENSVDPVSGLLVEGERVLQKGVIVTPEDLVKIKVLGNHALTLSNYSIFGSIFYLVILFVLAWIFMSPLIIRVSIKRSQMIIMISGLLVYFILAMLIIRLGNFSDFYPISVLLPSAMISVMLTILINSRVGIFITIIYSLGLLLQTRMEPYAFLFALFTGIIGSVAVSSSEKKGYLIRATGILALSGGIVLFIIGLLKGLTFSRLVSMLGLGALNGMASGILAIGILPFIEHLLNAATPSRLMELSDLNTPLFKRMLVLAPGTYGHSISVANLAESASREIGANALLARVGAYYHDIGKIDQAEYFAENQTVGNKHDELKPTLSTTVIKTHVKIGVEKGKELTLPKEVIDIIDQHHGSGLISYFYIQAMKEQNGKVKPEDFSYHGIPPQSREAAIVMLADSVEAASRTLVKPNVAKLEKFIWEIIMDKVEKQQMRGCELTFRDLETIKKTFVQILAGHFHTRIEYPDMKNQPELNGKNKK